MEFKRGNTYKLQAVINGVDINDIAKVRFQFADISKIYMSDGTGDVTYEDGAFIVRFTQAETLTFNTTVPVEIAVKFTDNEVKRSKTENCNLLDTIIEESI